MACDSFRVAFVQAQQIPADRRIQFARLHLVGQVRFVGAWWPAVEAPACAFTAAATIRLTGACVRETVRPLVPATFAAGAVGPPARPVHTASRCFVALPAHVITAPCTRIVAAGRNLVTPRARPPTVAAGPVAEATSLAALSTGTETPVVRPGSGTPRIEAAFPATGVAFPGPALPAGTSFPPATTAAWTFVTSSRACSVASFLPWSPVAVTATARFCSFAAAPPTVLGPACAAARSAAAVVVAPKSGFPVVVVTGGTAGTVAAGTGVAVTATAEAARGSVAPERFPTVVLFRHGGFPF